jgi:glycosyltransferase involved in cell wall biosynthesis
MKILYHFRTRGTGAEGVHIAGIARAFEKIGHRVFFSSPTGVDPRATAGASPYRESGSQNFFTCVSRNLPAFVFELLEIGYNIPAFFRNAAILRREKIGLIYERHAFFLCATALLSRWRRVPLVVEVNELVGDERVRVQPLLAPLARWCDRVVFRAAKMIFVVSPHLARRIESLGIDARKILVLPNAVDRADFESPGEGCAVRARHGFEDVTVIGFVGWFVAWHRLDLLLESFSRIAASRPALRLMLVGDGELRGELERCARELRIAERVIFTGAVPHDEMPAHIAAMDVCVVPHSNAYRSPIKLFEYMVQARAVVAPRTEPIAMVIADEKNGLLFDLEDAGTLEKSLTRFADDAALRERLGAQARRDVLEKFTWEKNAGTVLASLACP